MFRRYKFIEGLTSLVGSNGKYLINYLGQVKDNMGNDIPTQLDDDGHLVVDVIGYLGFGKYRIIDLMAIQYKDLKIPASAYMKVKAFVIDSDKTNVQAKNVGYRFEGKRLEVAGRPGFYYVPSYTSVAINDEGALLNVRLDRVLTWYLTPPNESKNIKGGYYVNSTNGPNGKRNAITRHRLMALVFLDYPDNCDSLVVNHKDGVPGNDWVDNLEWCTRGQNNTHAYENDLKNQHMRVLARNVLTGEVVEYYSISECARRLGYPTDETIRFRLNKCAFGVVFQDGYQFKYKSDERDWVVPENAEEAIQEANFRIAVKSRNCLTGVEAVHDSMIAAGKSTGVNHATIRLRLSKGDKSPLGGHQFAFAGDESPWAAFTQEAHLQSLVPSRFGVDARQVLTGEVVRYESVNQAAEAVGNHHVAEMLRKGKQPLLPSGWQLKLSDDIWEDLEDAQDAVYRQNKAIMARNETTGQLIVAESSRRMAAELDIDPKQLRKAALGRGEMIYRGYRFRLGVSNEPWPVN